MSAVLEDSPQTTELRALIHIGDIRDPLESRSIEIYSYDSFSEGHATRPPSDAALQRFESKVQSCDVLNLQFTSGLLVGQG